MRDDKTRAPGATPPPPRHFDKSQLPVTTVMGPDGQPRTLSLLTKRYLQEWDGSASGNVPIEPGCSDAGGNVRAVYLKREGVLVFICPHCGAGMGAVRVAADA